MIDPDLKHLVRPYVERRKRDLARIHEALGNSEFEVIRIIGHQIKGNAGQLGFDALGKLGARLEEAADESDTTAIRKVAHEIESFVNAIHLD